MLSKFCSVPKEYTESIIGDQTKEGNVSDILNKGLFPKGFSLLISAKTRFILECLSFIATENFGIGALCNVSITKKVKVISVPGKFVIPVKSYLMVKACKFEHLRYLATNNQGHP